MHVFVHAFFRGGAKGTHQERITGWKVYHLPAEVAAELLPQAVTGNRPVVIPARLLRAQLARAIDIVEAAISLEETETVVDDAEQLCWLLRDFVTQCEAAEQETGHPVLFRASS
jgi:hypothetical protein